MAQLKFYKAATQPSGVQAGAIFFNTTNRTIEVFNGSTWEKFAGKLESADWDAANQQLVIKKFDGSQISLDFSKIASLDNVVKAINDAKSELVGKAEDAASANTIYGAKNKAAAELQAAKSELLGSASDTKEKNTIYGAKAYADAAVAALNTENRDQRITNLETAVQDLEDYHTETLPGVIDGKINLLDANVDSKGGEKVAVNVVETDGKITSVSVTETDIASAKDLQDEVGAREITDGKVSDLQALIGAEKLGTGEQTVLQKIAALSSATHFRGAFADHTALADPAEGDIVVNTTTGKEYIYSNGAWVELGDTSDEVRRIGELEGKLEGVGTKVTSYVADQISGIAEVSKDGSQNGIKVTVKTKSGSVSSVAVEASEFALQSALNTTNNSITTLGNRVSAISGESADTYTKPSGTNYIDNASSLKDADLKLDAAIKAVADVVSGGVGVMSVTTDGTDLSINPTSGDVKISVNKTDEVTSGDAALVTSGAVHAAIESALAWAQFE